MTKDEALRLALEVLQDLEDTQSYWWQEVDEVTLKQMEPAITAIKAALEAKDEPVAQPKVRTGNCLRVGVCASEGHKIQPQRTWVGLTLDDIPDDDTNNLDFYRGGRWAERVIKEKNT